MSGAIGVWPVRVEAGALGEQLARQLPGELFRPWQETGSQKAIFHERFASHSQWVLIMATGIAARFIDGLLQDKHHDPAVVVIDEAARYAIALVGGHEGGANALAYKVANVVGATPVVTTATEATRPLVVGIGCRRGVSADQIEAAVLHALSLRAGGVECAASGSSRGGSPRVSGVALESAAPGEAATGEAATESASPDDAAPRTEKLPANLAQVREFVTVDLKAGEPGLLALSQRTGIPVRVIAKHQIETRAWVTQPSEWVRQSVGLDGVCEPCALIACPRGRLAVPKTTLDGVAVAVVEDDWSRAP